jgi:hypothetical protein
VVEEAAAVEHHLLDAVGLRALRDQFADRRGAGDICAVAGAFFSALEAEASVRPARSSITCT